MKKMKNENVSSNQKIDMTDYNAVKNAVDAGILVELTADFDVDGFFNDYDYMLNELNELKQKYGHFVIHSWNEPDGIMAEVRYYRDAKEYHNEKIQQQIDALEAQKRLT